MSRCQICNYCPEAGSESLYESTGAVSQTVKFRKSVNKDVCALCWEGILLNKLTYETEARDEVNEYQFNFDYNSREYEETDDPPWFEESFNEAYEKQQEEQLIDEVERNTPALSEV